MPVGEWGLRLAWGGVEEHVCVSVVRVLVRGRRKGHACKATAVRVCKRGTQEVVCVLGHRGGGADQGVSWQALR